MAETQDDFWRDVSIVVKHIRFIVALFVVAVLVAIGTGLMANARFKARSSAEINVVAATPLFGGMDTVPTVDTFENLAMSDQVAEAAARQAGIGAEEIKSRISVTTVERNPRDPFDLDRLTIEATGNSRQQAQTIAGAAIAAFVQAAKDVRTDPEAVESQRHQEELARQALDKFDRGDLVELGQVQVKLTGKRSLIATLSSEVAAIDLALDLLKVEGSRPLGELVVAVAGILGGPRGTGGIEQAASVDELKGGLELRRQLSQDLLDSAQSEVTNLAQREQELLVSTAGQGAAMQVYTSALRNEQAARLAGSQTQTEVTVTARAVDTSSGGANWPARLGAAAAFGLVAGVGGAFALELLNSAWLRRRQRNASSRAEEA